MEPLGIAAAAIEGLYQMLNQKEAEIVAQREEIRALRANQAAMARQMEELGVLKARLDSLEMRGGVKSASPQ